MNISSTLTKVIEQTLPALSGNNITYNKQHNIYLSDGYTSAMGNTYYQGIRLSNRIIIFYNMGEGFKYTFLNGIRIYGFNGKEKKLIATRDFNCHIFSEIDAKNICIEMIKDYIMSEAKLANGTIISSELSDFADKLITEVIKNKPSRLLN